MGAFRQQASGNVFEDFGFGPEAAANLEIRSDLMDEVLKYIEEQGLTQAVAAERFGIPRSRVSDLKRGHIDKFTIDKLVNMLARVGRHAEVKVTKRHHLKVYVGAAEGRPWGRPVADRKVVEARARRVLEVRSDRLAATGRLVSQPAGRKKEGTDDGKSPNRRKRATG